MKKTFFDYLGVADKERIHSQTIQWIFSKDNEALTDDQKTQLIKDLFGRENFKVKEVITEYYNIDIVIFSEDKRVICIENKLKSSQHSNQLNRYKELMDKEKFLIEKDTFFFLTLIDEKPEDDSWKNINYTQLYEQLEKLRENKTIADNTHGKILGEYIDTVKNLSKAVEDFIKNPAAYKNVFSKGKHPEANGEVADYISRKQLETIFQKLYLGKAMETDSNKNYRIFEQRGFAVLQIVLVKDEPLSNGKEFHFTLDYQDGTFKFLCIIAGHEEYNNSKPEDIPLEVKNKFDGVLNDTKYGYQKTNSGKTKATYSLTKKDNSIVGISIEDFRERLKKEYNNAMEIIDSLKLESVES